MVYVGSMNGKAFMFHDIWGVAVRNWKGDEFKQVIGKSIVSTLTPGSELHLAANTILERVNSLLLLGDRFTCPSQPPSIQKPSDKP
jgi:hypothetical protein